MRKEREFNFTASPAWRTAIDRLATAWCQLMHDSAMWPTHGKYECRTCGLEYPVPWAATGSRPVASTGALGVSAAYSSR